MKYEALFWIGVILATPVWYMLASTLFELAISAFWTKEKITLEVTDECGNTVTKVFYVENSADLVGLLDELKKRDQDHPHV